MKKLALVLLLLPMSIATIAQTLKITSVETTDPNKYQEMAEAHLGKTVTLKIYDNAITFTEQGMPVLYLKKVRDDEYLYSSTEDNSEKTMLIDIHYTVGVITSMDIQATTKNKYDGYTNTVTAVAKRF